MASDLTTMTLEEFAAQNPNAWVDEFGVTVPDMNDQAAYAQWASERERKLAEGEPPVDVVLVFDDNENLVGVHTADESTRTAAGTFTEELHPREHGRFSVKEIAETPGVTVHEPSSTTTENAGDYAFRNQLADGLSQQQQSELIWNSRETYEPVAALADGAQRWTEENGLAPIPDGILNTPVNLAEAEAVGQFFDQSPDMAGDPNVEAAYNDFKEQSDRMFDFVTRPESEGGLGITVEFTNRVDPYPTARAQAEDLRQNNHITIESGLGGSHGATMTTSEYDRFRAVHDIFGHAAVGGGFDRHGEYQAWLMHSAMYTPPGRDAMSTEYHGVNSALWASKPGEYAGTGKSVLLPAEYAAPPWERAAIAAALAGMTVSDEVRKLADDNGFDAGWANQYEPWPWHWGPRSKVVPNTEVVRKAYADTQERDFHGRFGPGGGGPTSGDLAHEAQGGGFTYSLTEHSLVHEGVAVSPYPEREQTVDAASFSASHIDAFEQANADLLSLPDHYMGAWLNPADDNVYLDVSIVSPTREAADAVGREHGQYASYNLATGETYQIDSGRGTAQATAEARRGAAPEGGDPGTEAGARGRHPESPTPATIKRSIDRLHKARERLGRKLLAGAEVAYAEALRRAGVKIATRTRSRGTSKTIQAQVRAVLISGASVRPLLAVLGLKEQDLLAQSFTSYEEQADGWLDDYRRRQLAEIERLGLDPADFGFDDTTVDQVQRSLGVGVIVGGLMERARGRLLGGVDHIMPGEVAGAIPAKLVLDGIKVSEGRAHATMGATLDDMPTVTALPNDGNLETELADLVEGRTLYEWAHGFYGDPTTPFEPHEALDGFTTADTESDPELLNGEAFPDGDYFQPGDHDGCTCEWVISSPGG